MVIPVKATSTATPLIDCMRVVVTYCGSLTFDGELGTFAGIHLPSGNQSRSMVFHFF